MMVQSYRLLLQALIAFSMVLNVHSWGSSSSTSDNSIYSDSYKRDWLYDATSISMKLEGCVWGYVADEEEAGCLQSSSQDGTYYWYQMANCRRPQAAFSLYSSDSSSSVGCNSNTYRETVSASLVGEHNVFPLPCVLTILPFSIVKFVTNVGISEFIGYLKAYDANSPFNSNSDSTDGWNVDELPMCEKTDQGYLGVGCASDGTFSIQIFQDAYCLSSVGTYNSLDKLNYNLKHYKSCVGMYSSSSGGDNAFATNVIPNTASCSSLDSALCTDDSAMSNRRGSASSSARRSHSVSSASRQKSWSTKLKYVAGAFLLIISFVMFTGILFTNRRRRRALIQRKYRQTSRSSRGDDKSRKSASRSTSRDPSRRSRSVSGRSKRSKSRSRGESEGVFT